MAKLNTPENKAAPQAAELPSAEFWARVDDARLRDVSTDNTELACGWDALRRDSRQTADLKTVLTTR